MSLKRLCFVAVLLLGCGSDEDTDEDTDTQSNVDTDEPRGCDEVSLKINGPDAPIVGDEWVVLMRCDEAIIQGPMVIRFTPPDFANLDGNTVIFTTAGEASMRVQVGGYRVDMDLSVLAE